MKFEIENETLMAVTLENDEKEVVIPDGITTIASSAFLRCRNMENVIIPSSVKTIEEKAFFKTNINEIEIPPSVEYIGNSCFGSCLNLKKVNIKGNIEKIEEYCFNCCFSLEEVILPDSLKSIEKFAFCNSKKLSNITLPNSLKEIKSYAFGTCEGLEEIEIPDLVEDIGSNAFYGCINLESVKLPSNITTLNHSTFSNCLSLEKINLPESLKNIDGRCFMGCESLKKITLPKRIESIGPYVFSGCEELRSIEIPYGIKNIEDSTFKGCKSLRNVTIPSSVKVLGDSCFSGCESLENIYLPKGVEKIRERAFGGCSKLSNVTLPSSLKEINYSAFFNCLNLKEISLPESLKTIAPHAFSNCNFDRVEINSFYQLQIREIVAFYYIKNVYFNKQTKSILLSKYNEYIEGYEKLNYDRIYEMFDVNDFRIAAILSLIVGEEDSLGKIKYFLPQLTRNINKDNYEMLKEKLNNSREFNMLLNYVSKQFNNNDPSIKEELCDLFKLTYSLGAFNEDKIERQKACEFIKNCFDKDVINFGNIHGSFESMDIKNFSKEWADFFMDKNNFKELIAIEKEQSGYISRIHNSFEAIKEFGRSNRGDQHYRKVTVSMAREYLARVYFRGVDDSNIDISETIGDYTRNQESFDSAVEIRKDYLDLKERGKIRDHIIEDIQEILDDLNDVANNRFTYEFLSKYDPKNFVLGKYCSCCAHLEGMGNGIMKASILHPDCQNLVIRDNKGTIIAKSTLYVNREQGYGLFNNVEINNNIYDDETKQLIYEKYIEAIDSFARAYNKENPKSPIKQINVGMHLNDLSKIIKSKNEQSTILQGINFSDYEGYKGDWQEEQYVIWKKDSNKR